MKTRWKFINENMTSTSGNHKWKLNTWYETKGNLVLCQNGFHGSKRIIDALGYVSTTTLAKVEVKGKSLEDPDKTKEVFQFMKIKKVYDLTKEDFVKFSIYSAKECLKYFEEKYPKDDRPRKAIEAAEAYIKNPSEETRSAARSAAESAARSAARSAAWSAARSAAWSAESVARSAAWSAESAAWSAESAARSAARSAAWSAESVALNKMKDKLEKWFIKNVLKGK